MKITVSKTIQIAQYEPLTVTVEEELPVRSNEDYQKLKQIVTRSVEDILAEEVPKYTEAKRGECR